MIGKQNETAKFQDVVVTCDEMKLKKEALFYKVNPIITRPKPVAKKEEVKVDDVKMDDDVKSMEEDEKVGEEAKAGEEAKDMELD
jgi:CMP-N-acetylneuraminic acid synthetase